MRCRAAQVLRYLGEERGMRVLVEPHEYRELVRAGPSFWREIPTVVVLHHLAAESHLLPGRVPQLHTQSK